MWCPDCGCHTLIVIETRKRPDNTIFRRRQCEDCGRQIRSLETLTDEAERPAQHRRRKPGPRKGKRQPGVNRALGERNGASVLTAKDVRRLRQLAAKGMLQKDIAVRYGIATATVSRIVCRKAWKHV